MYQVCAECGNEFHGGTTKRKMETGEDDMVSSVIMAEGETLGQLDLIVQLSKLDNVSTRKLEDKISAHRCPMLVLKWYKPRTAVRLCQTQQII